MAYTGALPQATWGAAAIGMAPSVVSKLKTSMAAASGIVAAGRCASTAIAITMGPQRDPEVCLVVQQVALWIDLFRGPAELLAMAIRWWGAAYARAVSNNANAPPTPAWNRVLGPLTATVAMLTQHGWNLANPVI